MTDETFKAAAPRKLFIDELETARMEVRSIAETSSYTPTLKILIGETEIRAKKMAQEENEAAKRFLERASDLRKTWGIKGMKDKFEPDEAINWLLAVEEFYIDIGLLEFETEEGNWVEDRLVEFYKKLER